MNNYTFNRGERVRNSKSGAFATVTSDDHIFPHPVVVITDSGRNAKWNRLNVELDLGFEELAAADARRELLGDMERAYRDLVRKTGFRNVDISAIIGECGQERGLEIKAAIIAMAKEGDATLSTGDWSLASDEIRSGAIRRDGRMYLIVRFPDWAPEPTAAATFPAGTLVQDGATMDTGRVQAANGHTIHVTVLSGRHAGMSAIWLQSTTTPCPAGAVERKSA